MEKKMTTFRKLQYERPDVKQLKKDICRQIFGIFQWNHISAYK